MFACLNLHVTLDNSPRAAGAKRLAKTSRRAVHMASSSYRLLPKVPVEVSLLLANARIGCLFYGTAPSTVTLFTRDRESGGSLAKCRLSEKKKQKKQKTPMLAEQLSSLFINRKKKKIRDFSSKKHNRWMHHGFIILARSPYGIVGVKVLSSDWVQVAQSPVS